MGCTVSSGASVAAPQAADKPQTPAPAPASPKTQSGQPPSYVSETSTQSSDKTSEWEAKIDPTSGQTYYEHHPTRTTSWTKPGVEGNSERWTRKVDAATGDPYWEDHHTQTTSWSPPPGMGNETKSSV